MSIDGPNKADSSSVVRFLKERPLVGTPFLGMVHLGVEGLGVELRSCLFIVCFHPGKERF